MKSPIQDTQEISTTTNVNNISTKSIKDSVYINNHLSKIAADHDVRISGTMIKVTYKKPIKDQFVTQVSTNGHSFNEKPSLNIKNLNNSLNKLNVQLNHDRIERSIMNRSVSESENIKILNNKKSISVIKGSDSPIFHSTPKWNTEATERKKKEYINGLDLLMKLKNKNLSDKSVNQYHIKPGVKMNSYNVAQTSSNVPIRASTSEKLQAAGIKLPKGITIIRVKGNGNKVERKPGSVEEISIKPKVKRDGSESDVFSSGNKLQIGLKRKFKVDNEVVPPKILKKNYPNSQGIQKKISKPNDVLNSSEIIIRECVEYDSPHNSSGYSRKEILRDDPELPPGWKRVVHTRYGGTPFEKHVVYIYSPQGKKFQFKWKLRRYLEKTKSPLRAEQFHFGLYKRTRQSFVPPNVGQEGEDTCLDDKIQLPKDKTPSNVGKSTLVSKVRAFNVKHSTPMSSPQGKGKWGHYTQIIKSEKNGQSFNNDDEEEEGDDAPSLNSTQVDKRQMLIFDPDLPLGWKRIINTNASTGKPQVNIISPDGRIFRRRYRLNEYLIKNEMNHTLDQFYFGLYPKKDPIKLEDVSNNSLEPNGTSDGTQNIKTETEEEEDEDSPSEMINDNEELILCENDMTKFSQYATPMYEDPNLPDGWIRFIKIRACGRNAGRMEVVIVSPDGKRFRSRAQMENYFQKNDIGYNPEDFDFNVFGRPRKRSHPIQWDDSNSFRRRSKPQIKSERPVADLDLTRVKDVKLSREGEMINSVTGMMISCELSTERSERRLRMPRNEHEKLLGEYLESQTNVKTDDGHVSPHWVQTLIKCRSDFRNLEPEAVSIIAKKTEDFIRELTIEAYKNAENAEASLEYNDIANVVDKHESLTYLKTFIPKKITYKEYVKLNRPKQFLSFT
ncbi:hypothetical protein RUM44_011539 [Polyplax serrata]|uniref:MBD domain-containing protein n=1 Tax=Polyplax serrata TaxID=468196 RepID=A0ABR1AQE2_POLSC